MHKFMRITKSLADENRIRILLALTGRELCVCQLIELLGLAPSTVSKHLSILRNAQLIDSRKQGRWMYYRLAGKNAPQDVIEALNWLRRSVSQKRLIMEDAKRLKEILEIDTEILCRRQANLNACETS